jgi:hypothetical protein
MLTTMAGPSGAHHAGSVIEVDKSTAYELIDAGAAAEVAALAQPETAARRRGGPKGRQAAAHTADEAAEPGPGEAEAQPV